MLAAASPQGITVRIATEGITVKLVHFVWVQGPVLPNDLVTTISRWQILNPDHAVCLWVDAANRPAISAAFEREPGVRVSELPPGSNPAPWLRNYGASSDLLRHQLLSGGLGGAYLDTDTMPVQAPSPPSGFLAHLSPTPLSDLAALSNDSLWTQPPGPLLQRMRS